MNRLSETERLKLFSIHENDALRFVKYLSCHYQIPGYEIEDLESIALLALHEATRCFDPDNGTPFRKFNYLVIKRALLTLLKWQTRKSRALLSKTLPIHLITPDTDGWDVLETDVHQIVEGRLLTKAVLEKCSPFERQVVEYWVLGYEYQEIADILGVANTKVVDNALARAQRKGVAYAK